ncbi:helix-turn-helix domain-containing protein [Mobilicoccus caccae]|nr:helix-turn-helix domain-containing protein [Mobilicoccus caccae]
MSRARAAVLEQLGRHPVPTTVGVLAAECGQHTNTVREHLDALSSAGLVVRTTGPAKGRGRPAIRYAAVPPEAVRPQMRQYVNLVGALSEQIGRAVPDPRAFAVEAGRLVQEQDDTPEVPGINAADSSLKLLTDLGFDPHVDDPAVEGDAPHGDETGVGEPEGESAPDVELPQAPDTHAVDHDEHGRPILKVRLRECPLLEAARRNPDVVCSVHLGAILAAYESRGEPTEGIDVVPFAEPGACLAYLPVSGQHPDTATDPGAPTADS